MQAGSEHTYYRQGNVAVTSTRVVIGSTTYALNNIASVSMRILPANRLLGLVLAGFGLVIGTICTVVTMRLLLIGVGLAFVVAGSILAALAKKRYVVRVSSTSGERNSLVSSDRVAVEQVVRAINEAIVGRAGP